MNALPGRLLVVTDRLQASRPLADVVEAALAGGARWIWLRDRDLPPDERRRLADGLADLARRAGAVLTIGADIALAATIGARSVQLQASASVAAARAALGADALIGVSAHGEADIRKAAATGADYVTLSPIFASASKPGYGPALGPAALVSASLEGIPVIALGGVGLAQVPACLAAGAAGIAVMGEIMRATDPAATVSAFLAATRAG